MTACISAVLVGVAVGMLGAALIIAVTLWAAARLSGGLVEEDAALRERPDDEQ